MKKRIHQLLTVLGITATKLADEIQVQRSGISHILSGRNQPSYDFLMRLLLRYPQLDARWLLTGEGDVFKKEINDNKVGKNDNIETGTPVDMVQSEDPPEYKVTDVTIPTVSRLIILHSDDTFEIYNPHKPH